LKDLLPAQSAPSASTSQLLRYVERQWINKLTSGPPGCLCVTTYHARTIPWKVPMSRLRRRIKVSHLKRVHFFGPSTAHDGWQPGRRQPAQPWNDHSTSEEEKIHSQRYENQGNAYVGSRQRLKQIAFPENSQPQHVSVATRFGVKISKCKGQSATGVF